MRLFIPIGVVCLVSACSNIEVQPRIPFVKMTMPAVAQVAPRAAVQPNVVQVPAVPDTKYEDMLSAYQQQQQEIKQLRADLSRVTIVNQQARQLPQRPVAVTHVYQPPVAHALVKKGAQKCDFLMRDLSRRGSKVVYCRPKR